MQVSVLRWPLLETSGKAKQKIRTRTRKPLQELLCFVDEGTLGVRGLVHLKFPGLMGWYDFRLSTGVCTLESMRDYVLDSESLKELRKLREQKKLEQKAAG